MRKRIILAARYYSIEPLGILYLTGLVRDLGWDCKVVLVRETDFDPLYEIVRKWKPDYVGFQIWTGYHIPAFAACDRVRAMGSRVIIGGPHATYFDKECNEHADFTVRASGFNVLRDILEGTISPGIHFDEGGREAHFPLPDRDVVYTAYPELGGSLIKSIFASVSCPYKCTYCYAPAFNKMHGGFHLTTRAIDDLIAEAKAIKERWPLEMIYFQDDIFGFDIKWLRLFAPRWKEEVGVPFHCQIRLELTQHSSGSERLDLFREAGCSGITLAIESGNEFLRDHVLFRHMAHELILEGCKKITDRGMTLRTEQILAVPFSNTETDLATLDLNNQINPMMAWTSILAPFGGTVMGTISTNFGFYTGNNDDLAETFFDRSVLRHVQGGPTDINHIIERLGAKPKSEVLSTLRTREREDGTAEVLSPDGDVLGAITYMSPAMNERYCEDTVRLQRLFMFLAKVPNAKVLGQRIIDLPRSEWTWRDIGRVTKEHLRTHSAFDLDAGALALAREMGYEKVKDLPGPIALNPWFFCFHPAGGELAKLIMEKRVFASFRNFEESLDELATLSRRHLFHHGLYQLDSTTPPPVMSC